MQYVCHNKVPYKVLQAVPKATWWLEITQWVNCTHRMKKELQILFILKICEPIEKEVSNDLATLQN